MDTLRRHEVFEIEVLERLKNKGLLSPLVFVGGTMLRLCYELNRYSTDLDFWFVKKVGLKAYFKKLKDSLAET
ncbi:MAG: nucleotidyl transferase AbiEii/AbiGii toxin family protein, partial [Candidatus Omnitrophica bacterium]|nr:nucleotidyl transferase AbiEii/AbiGii toxin family protein [Candidatus Omnitrophota bacterium]